VILAGVPSIQWLTWLFIAARRQAFSVARLGHGIAYFRVREKGLSFDVRPGRVNAQFRGQGGRSAFMHFCISAFLHFCISAFLKYKISLHQECEQFRITRKSGTPQTAPFIALRYKNVTANLAA
jgi:hypothetical protein